MVQKLEARQGSEFRTLVAPSHARAGFLRAAGSGPIDPLHAGDGQYSDPRSDASACSLLSKFKPSSGPIYPGRAGMASAARRVWCSGGPAPGPAQARVKGPPKPLPTAAVCLRRQRRCAAVAVRGPRTADTVAGAGSDEMPAPQARLDARRPGPRLRGSRACPAAGTEPPGPGSAGQSVRLLAATRRRGCPSHGLALPGQGASE